MIRLRGLKGRLRRRLATWLGRQAVVLLYHRVVDEVADDPSRLCVSAERLADQLDWLAERFQIVPAAEIGRLAAGRWRGGPLAAITFDDGYVDNLEKALPVLASLELPATVFVTTGPVRRQEPFWWDELAHLVLSDSRLGDYRQWIGPHAQPMRLSTSRGGRQRAYELMHRWLKPLDYGRRRALLAQIRRTVAVPADSAAEPARPMTPAELRRLAASPWIQIGSHTVDHLVLAAQPLDEQRRQIEQSLADLRQWLGQDVELLSYPFGTAEDVGPAAPHLARSAGIRTAFMNHAGPVWPGADPLRLPRVLVRNWPVDELVHRLQRLQGLRRHVA